MPEEITTELLDAREFKRKLIARTKNKGDEEGQKIGEYLNNIMPDWQGKRATLLHKNIKGMLKNVEEAKRFGIEQFGKQALYIIPLMVIFFSVFGYFLYFILDFLIKVRNSTINFSDISIEDKKGLGNSLMLVSVAIAFINAFLAFCLTAISARNQKQQENWDHHISYLQAILGLKLMRAELGKTIKFKNINILVGFSMLIIWLYITYLFSQALFLFAFEENCEPVWANFCVPNDLDAFKTAASVSLILLGCAVYMLSASLSFFDEKDDDTMLIINIKNLENFRYTEGTPTPSKKYIQKVIYILIFLLLVVINFFLPIFL